MYSGTLKLRFAAIIVFAFCIFNFSFAFAQPLPERVPLIGKVTTSGGTPIGGAQVTVRRQDAVAGFTAAFWGGQLRTDANGIFAFPEAEEGVYYVLIDAPGFASESLSLNWKPESPSPQTKLLKLTPLPLRIVSPDGTLLPAGARVQLYLRGEPPGRTIYPLLVTSGDGRIVVPDLVPARYWIQVIVAGQGYAILPSLNVQENTMPEVDVLLREGGKVRAMAKNEDGKPIGGAALGLSEIVPDNPANPGGITMGNDGSIYLYTQRSTLLTRDGDGTMELLDVAPGRYQSRMFLPGETVPAAQIIEVKAGETAQLTEVFKLRQTKASLEIAVQNVMGQAAPNRDFVVRLQPLVNGQPVPLAANGPPMPPDAPSSVLSLFQGVLMRRIHTDGNGKATLFPLRAGAWRITLADAAKPNQEPQDQPTSDVNLGGETNALTIKLKS